jgi:hypothetical protein
LTDLGFAEGAKPSDAEVLAAARQRYADVLEHVVGTLDVGADAGSRLETTTWYGDAPKRETEPHALTLVRRDGAHWFARRATSGSTTEPDPDDDFRVQWNGTDLRLVFGSKVIVFRRAP